MPEQKEVPISDLELVYINGQEHGAPPVFKDVRLTRESQNICDNLLGRARNCDKKIRSDRELKICVDTRKELQDGENQIKWLAENERRPWQVIVAQITVATESIRMQYSLLKAALKARVEEWEEQKREGAKKETERLEREAEELEVRARTDSDPQIRRRAKVQANQKREAAKETKATPESGFATEEYYDYEIENRALAAKLPNEAVPMNVNGDWFDQRIKEAKRNKMPIPVWPGIRLILRTRVRFTK